jgi:hypothetical protein
MPPHVARVKRQRAAETGRGVELGQRKVLTPTVEVASMISRSPGCTSYSERDATTTGSKSRSNPWVRLQRVGEEQWRLALIYWPYGAYKLIYGSVV